ncbi:hypothetical protein EOD39_0462 [Acipenser ruthenus]|uniref:Uncharacterized protein n=1 Tax=Acipenser ruthenus TaxID=7906 RepID=A0A444U2Z8_ACIRT|nr:hypothetical protein EOD39_0462 [Acipenser ruthenus]
MIRSREKDCGGIMREKGRGRERTCRGRVKDWKGDGEKKKNDERIVKEERWRKEKTGKRETGIKGEEEEKWKDIGMDEDKCMSRVGGDKGVEGGVGEIEVEEEKRMEGGAEGDITEEEKRMEGEAGVIEVEEERGKEGGGTTIVKEQQKWKRRRRQKRKKLWNTEASLNQEILQPPIFPPLPQRIRQIRGRDKERMWFLPPLTESHPTPPTWNRETDLSEWEEVVKEEQGMEGEVEGEIEVEEGIKEEKRMWEPRENPIHPGPPESLFRKKRQRGGRGKKGKKK